MRKKDINEIIDGDDNLIGTDSYQPSGANKDTEANNTTDYNAMVHGQQFKNDFMGRFGFYFYESESVDIKGIENKISKLFYGKFLQSLDYYKENPDQLDKDYEKHLGSGDFDLDNVNSTDRSWTKEVMKLIEPIIKAQIDENLNLKEDLVEPEKKNLKNEKDDDKELTAKAKKVADLIDKLSQEDKDKIKNILEN